MSEIAEKTTVAELLHAVQTSETRYRRLFESAQDGILILDAVSGKITASNPFMSGLLDYSREEFVGKELWEIGLLADEDESKAAFTELQRNGYIRYEDLPLKTKGGEVRQIEFVSNVYEEGDRKVIQCNIRDITARKKIEGGLASAEARLRLALEAARLGTFDWDILNDRIVWSLIHEELWGYAPGGFAGTYAAFVDRIHPDDVPEINLKFEHCIETRDRFSHEFRVVWPNKSIRWIFSNGEFEFDHSGKPIKMLGAVTDITERIQGETDLQKSRESMARAQKVAKLGSWETDLATMSVTCSEEMHQIFETDSASFSPTHEAFLQLVHPDDRAAAHKAFVDSMSKHGTCSLEHRVLMPDGRIKVIDWQWEIVRDDNDAPVVAVGTCQDVTTRTLAEASQRASEERLRMLFEQMKDGFYYSTPDGQLLDVNPAMVEMFGFSSREEMLKVDVTRDLYFSTEERYKQTRNEGKNESEAFRMRRKDGSEIWVEDRGQYKYDSEGKIEFHQGVLRDVTERRLAEASLTQSAERYRDLVENAYDMIYTRDLEGNFTSINAAGEKLIGYSREEFVRLNLSHIVVPEDLGRAMDLIAGKLSGSEGTTYEMDNIAKDGRRITLEVNTTLMYRDGIAIGVQGIARDITERKKSEETLRLLETSVSRLNDIVLITEAEPVDEPGPRILFVNDAFVRRTGFSREEVIGKTPRLLQGPKTQRDVLERIRTALKSWQPVREEVINYTKSGEEFWLELDIVPVANENGWFTHWVAIERDITERKKSEEAHSRLVAMLESSPDFAGYVDAKTSRVLYINKGGRKLLGFGEDEDVTKRTISDMHPAWAFEILRDEIIPIVRREGAWSGECSFLHRDGRELPGLMAIMAHKSSAGTVEVMSMMSHDITDRKKAEESLRQTNALVRIAGELTLTGGWAMTVPDNQVFWSDEIFDILEFPRGEVPDLAARIALCPEPDGARVTAGLDACSKDGTPFDIEVEMVTGKGRRIWAHFVAEADRRVDGTIHGIHGALQDISARKQTEDQLRQAQKLESVGRLAGGIAHDFNNMLTAINGYSELTLRAMKSDDPLRRNIQEIKKAGDRSAALTNQLLVFSRQQILRPEVVNLNRIITETSTLLTRMIGEDVELITVLDAKTGKIKADPGQLSQIIMNLAVNARDAMPKGGKLTFETKNIFLDKEYTNHHFSVLPGAYVKLTVSDNGTGMDTETQQHIFEPFFTTKATGEGTGLGLSMVYGIVKQSNGHIMVYSEPGVGTTFTIYLPRVMDALEETEVRSQEDDLPTGIETILLVEDEENVRRLTRQILEMCGYTVLEATSGKVALEISKNHPGEINLLMTDVVMPEIGGRELAEKALLICPQMLVLFTSGYTDDAVVRHGVIAEKANFIQKPFTTHALARKVRDIFNTAKKS